MSQDNATPRVTGSKFFDEFGKVVPGAPQYVKEAIKRFSEMSEEEIVVGQARLKSIYSPKLMPSGEQLINNIINEINRPTPNTGAMYMQLNKKEV